jgi:hypothetical protein
MATATRVPRRWNREVTLIRIQKLSLQFEQGLISPREFRSRMVAMLSMLDDEDTWSLAIHILGKTNG